MIRILGFTGEMGSGKSTVTQLINGKLPNIVHTIKFAGPLYDMQNYIYSRIGQTPIKDRKLLQWLGTEWGREQDENLWVNVWLKDTMRALEDNATSVIVCDDCRFNNEAEAIRSLGGKVIKVQATKDTRGKRIPLINTGHASEAGIKPEYVDYTLNNDGSLLDLENSVKAMLTSFGLLTTAKPIMRIKW